MPCPKNNIEILENFKPLLPLLLELPSIPGALESASRSETLEPNDSAAFAIQQLTRPRVQLVRPAKKAKMDLIHSIANMQR